ncbi:N-acetylneuraminate 9-O-acetyltransferase isoform X3 [Lagopus leucura]|uniref:N-acetylneuraminate 9-O-acetyltransferase isoform X3 n=1 Tax=Lagopus leucura TaxID=30410 RepID=UPI001C674792|nr:N-acetylneuraminate 9-O-acetyltransferase isoform X3 [Lagopus leucura]
MAGLAYTLGKREINYYFSVRTAKALALGAVLLLAACHAASRRYRGDDTCEYLLSSGRFLGEKVWQPHSCMMHKYKNSEAKNCLIDKHIVFLGDSRIRQLFYSFIKIINPQVKEEGNKHGNIPFEDKFASIKVDFLWYPEVNGSMRQRIKSWTEGSVAKPHIIVAGAATWSIKIHNGSNEALTQYKINITSIAPLLEKLAKSSDVYWILQDPVNEDMLSESRKMITNEKINAYNEAAVRILNSSSRNSKAKVKLFSVSKLIAQETIMKSSDGLHLPESSRDTTKVLNREQTDEWKGWMQLVILIYHISGASTFLPVYMHIRVLVAAYLFQTGYGHFSYFWIKGDFGVYRVCQVLFRLNFLVVVLCIVMDRPYQFYYFVPLVTVWFMIIYATLAMWPQIVQKKANGNCLWHFGLLLKLICLLACIYVLSYSQGAFEKVFSFWPLSKCFELNGNVYEWWFRWKLDRYVVFHGMLFAFIYLALQKHQMISEGKGDPLFSSRVSNVLLFISIVSFLTYSIWASSCKNKAECNELHPSVSVVQILAFILIRNIPGYVRSVYSSFFAWFGKISLELFICQYHIWLAADTKGILVLIPGYPMFNVIVSTFIFVCVAHEISQITNDLAQIVVPKDNSTLLKRLLCIAGFFSGLLFFSAMQEQSRH